MSIENFCVTLFSILFYVCHFHSTDSFSIVSHFYIVYPASDWLSSVVFAIPDKLIYADYFSVVCESADFLTFDIVNIGRDLSIFVYGSGEGGAESDS